MTTELELLGERIAEQAAHLDAAMHRVLTDLREFDTRGGWYMQGALSCAHWLAWRVGCTATSTNMAMRSTWARTGGRGFAIPRADLWRSRQNMA